MKQTRTSHTGWNAQPLTIQDLLSYKVIAVANAMSAGSAMRLRREFDISLGEWRVLGLIASSASHSLNGLARAANLDKGQMSRVISTLVERGLVTRQTPAKKGLTVHLTLTLRGKRLYDRLIDIAGERNERFAACLTPAERAAMDSALPKLFAVAREYVRPQESARAPASSQLSDSSRRGKDASGASSRIAARK